MPPAQLVWRTSSRCNQGNCVEVSTSGPMVLLRDSKDPDGPILAFDPHRWEQFLSGVKAGEFDV